MEKKVKIILCNGLVALGISAVIFPIVYTVKNSTHKNNKFVQENSNNLLVKRNKNILINNSNSNRNIDFNTVLKYTNKNQVLSLLDQNQNSTFATLLTIKNKIKDNFKLQEMKEKEIQITDELYSNKITFNNLRMQVYNDYNKLNPNVIESINKQTHLQEKNILNKFASRRNVNSVALFSYSNDFFNNYSYNAINNGIQALFNKLETQISSLHNSLLDIASTITGAAVASTIATVVSSIFFWTWWEVPFEIADTVADYAAVGYSWEAYQAVNNFYASVVKTISTYNLKIANKIGYLGNASTASDIAIDIRKLGYALKNTMSYRKIKMSEMYDSLLSDEATNTVGAAAEEEVSGWLDFALSGFISLMSVTILGLSILDSDFFIDWNNLLNYAEKVAGN